MLGITFEFYLAAAIPTVVSCLLYPSCPLPTVMDNGGKRNWQLAVFFVLLRGLRCIP
jgi:hypothetical protein